MKKILIAATAAALLTSAYADSCASSFSGFYAGVQAGLGNASGKVKLENLLSGGAGGVFAGEYKTAAGDKSFVGGLLAGYGMGVGTCAYVGGEVSVNFDSFSSNLINASTLNTSFFNVKIKRQYNIGAKLRLGYTASQQVMLFLGLGVEYAPTKLKAVNAREIGSDIFAGREYQKTKRNFAFAPSVGMDVLLNKNLFIRGEYTYAIGALKAKIDDALQQNPAGLRRVATIKANLDQHRFMLAVGYKF